MEAPRNKTPDSHLLADRMSHKFKSVCDGRSQFTTVFAESPVPAQLAVTRDAAMMPGEVPAVLYFRSEACWVLLTSHRVVSSSNSGVLEALLIHVQGVEVARDFKAPGYDQLMLVLDDMRKIELHVEPGPGHIAFWNSLLVALRILAKH